MKFIKTEEFIKKKLQKELPEHLYYHSINHVADVLSASIRLAEAEKINEKDLVLLKTAVLFHDSGFITQSKNHEELSCEIVREALPDFNYTHEEIDSICGMIMATKIPQSPTNLLEQIIADADLDYLGREDYWEISNNLFKEISFFGIFTEKDWLQLQINFLEKHHYFTNTAILTREAKKQETLGILRKGLI